MVKIIFGRQGTPKGEYIREKIAECVAEKRQAYWLVPEQKAVICERTLATELDAGAQLYAEVVNFSRLADKVFRKHGGLKYNYISQSGKNLVMYRTLCDTTLKLDEYTITRGKERGLISLFVDAVGELKSYLITPEELALATQSLDKSHDRLKRRISDLEKIYKSFNNNLEKGFTDPYDMIINLAKVAREHEFFKGTSVFISSFDGFTGAQLGVIREIINQAKDVYISLDMQSGDEGKTQFAKLSRTLRAIRTMCDSKLEIEELNEDTYHENPCIEYLCNNIWSFGAEAYKGRVQGVTLMRPKDEFDECERVAGKIRGLVMNGAKYGEIAVIMRSADTYRGIIDYCFNKYDIPYYLSASTDVTSKPVIKMLYSAINASCEYNTRDITSFIRSGYVDITPDEADELESYVWRWGIYGSRFTREEYWKANPDGYESEITDLQRSRLDQIKKTRNKIIDTLSPLAKAFEQKRSAKELCTAVYDFIVSLGVREKLREEIAQADGAEKRELSQLYRAIMYALGLIADTVQDEELDVDGFISALTYALDGVKVGSIPTGEDNVTIGEAGALRADKIKYAFVLGVCEGSFPLTVSGSSFFSDSDKRALDKALGEKSLSADSSERADDELLNFKNSIAVASHGLVISAPVADIKGTKRSPSLAYKRVKALLPSLSCTEEINAPVEDKIYTKSVALEYLSDKGELGDAIRRALGQSATSESELDIRVRQELDASQAEDCFSNEDSQISPEGIEEIFGKRLYLSDSKISKFAKCQFSYYCSFVLGIKESDKIDFGNKEIGVLTHSILEHFMKRIKKGEITDTLTDDEIEMEIGKIASDYIDKLFPNRAPTSRLSHLFERLKGSVLYCVRQIVNEVLEGGFKPELFEAKLIKKTGLAPLVVDAGEGRELVIRGTADRVDFYPAEDGETLYARVVDYKTGEKGFKYKDFRNGTALQLFIYLFTLCKMDKSKATSDLIRKAKKIEPASVMYLAMSLGKASAKTAVDTSTEDKVLEAERKQIEDLIDRRGVFLDNDETINAQGKDYLPKKGLNEEYFVDRDTLNDLEAELKRIIGKIGKDMFSGKAKAKPLHTDSRNSECRYCKLRAICRRREQ